MELWIRSQDKEELIKINNRLFIKEIYDIGFGIYDDLLCDDGFITLGIYKTKERALEVLDEIQNKLLKSKYYKAKEDYGKHIGFKNTLIEISSSIYVYEMPKN